MRALYVQKNNPKNNFIQIPFPECFSLQVPEGCSSLSEQLMGLLTGWTVDPLWAVQSGSDWGVNNCIVLSCYSCCSSPACLVCPSEQQMTRTQCGWRRNVSERSPLQQPGSCESTWHGHSRSTLPSSANESHFVWLPLPWCGGIFFLFFWENIRMDFNPPPPFLNQLFRCCPLLHIKDVSCWIYGWAERNVNNTWETQLKSFVGLLTKTMN